MCDDNGEVVNNTLLNIPEHFSSDVLFADVLFALFCVSLTANVSREEIIIMHCPYFLVARKEE